MKRRTFIGRALGAIGLGAVAVVADLKMAEATEALPLLGTAKNPRQISTEQDLVDSVKVQFQIDSCASTQAREMLKRILEQGPIRPMTGTVRYVLRTEGNLFEPDAIAFVGAGVVCKQTGETMIPGQTRLERESKGVYTKTFDVKPGMTYWYHAALLYQGEQFIIPYEELRT